MGSRLGRRVVHFANLPLKLMLPTSGSLDRIREFALKTSPSATKFEIKTVLQSLYGFDVEEVRTLNMDGKKKKRGGLLLSQPDFKKAYVTLRRPLSLPPDLFPLPQIREEADRKLQHQKKGRHVKAAVVVDEDSKRKERRHWLDDRRDREGEEEVGRDRWDRERRGGRGKIAGKDRRRRGAEEEEPGMFPWSKMRLLSLG